MEETTTTEGFVTLAPGVIASDFSLKNLNKALGSAQHEFGSATKSETNKYAGYNYTPLESIIKAVRPSLTKHHLTVSQYPSTDLQRKTVTVVTRLSHWDSGEWIQNSLEMPAELALGKDGSPRFNQQTIGGSNTYAQKYAYKAILGIPDSEELIDSSEEKGNLNAIDNTPTIKVHLQSIEESPSVDQLKKNYQLAYKWATSVNDREAITLFSAAKDGRKKVLESPLNQKVAQLVEQQRKDLDYGDAHEGD